MLSRGSTVGAAMIRVFYVYIFFRPWDGSPCYVGKGRGKRWCYFRGRKNPELSKIISEAGGELPSVKIRDGLTADEALSIEAAFIEAIGRAPNGPLVNLTAGGQAGTSGFRFKNSDETRRKKSIAATGRNFPPEVREKIRAKATGRVLSAETRAKMSAAGRGRPKSESHRQKIGTAQRGVPKSAEHCARISAAWMFKRIEREFQSLS